MDIIHVNLTVNLFIERIVSPIQRGSTIRERLGEIAVSALSVTLLLSACYAFSTACGQTSSKKAEHLIIVLPGLLADRSFVENIFSRSYVSWFYLVTTGTVQTEAGKPPPRPLVVAIGYSLAHFDVLVGWGGDWVMLRGADILSRRETIMVELRDLMSKDVLRLKEEEWRKVKSSIEEATEWEFGVELSPTEGIWRQRFPKAKPDVTAKIEQTSIWLMKTGQSTTDTSTTLSTQELPSSSGFLSFNWLLLLIVCILMLIAGGRLSHIIVLLRARSLLSASEHLNKVLDT